MNQNENPITKKAREILANFEDKLDQPASLSLLHHKGLSMRDHLELCASIMQHLCTAYNVVGEDRDMLIACCYLHDIGKFLISKKGYVENGVKDGWLYYEASGWSRLERKMKEHPILSCQFLESYDIPRKEEIKRIISCHMAHWYKNTPQPKTMYEHMMVAADYISAHKEDIFNYTPQNSEYIKK